MTNTLPDHTHPCPDCKNSFGESTGFVSRHNWNEECGIPKPTECPSCKGRGYVFDATVQPVRDIIIVTLPANAEDTLQELRAMLWECRNFKPGAVALRIAVSDMLTAVQEAKEVVK
jgi:hypothetical protein